MEYVSTMTKEQIEDAWNRFGDVPVGDDDCILLPFSMELGAKYIEGTDRFEIWHDFDELYADWGGVHALMFPSEHR